MIRMKTLLISGGSVPLPGTLREVIARGSTSLNERRAADIDPSTALSEVDRVVFWASSGDAAIHDLAERFARAEKTSRREALVFVTDAGERPVPGLSDTEFFVWPQDEDRLTMAFLTGA
jgi:hypothetical protein